MTVPLQMLARTMIVLALLSMLPFADADAYCNGSVNLARTCFNVDNSTGQCLSELSSVYSVGACCPHWMISTHLNDGIAPIEGTFNDHHDKLGATDYQNPGNPAWWRLDMMGDGSDSRPAFVSQVTLHQRFGSPTIDAEYWIYVGNNTNYTLNNVCAHWGPSSGRRAPATPIKVVPCSGVGRYLHIVAGTTFGLDAGGWRGIGDYSVLQLYEVEVDGCRSSVDQRPAPLPNWSSILPDLAACTMENRTMQEIVQGPGAREQGFFRGGLGEMADRTFKTWGCWRKHACLDDIGLANTGDAICYKRDSSDGSWHLWGLQSEIGTQCSAGNSSNTGAFDPNPPASPADTGFWYPWPTTSLTAKRIRHVSNYTFPFAVQSRVLEPIVDDRRAVASSDTVSLIDLPPLEQNWAYTSAKLGPDGKVYFVPFIKSRVMPGPWDSSNQGHFGIVDPSTDTFTFMNHTTAMHFQFLGSGALAANGKMYFEPHDSNVIGIVGAPLERGSDNPPVYDDLSMYAPWTLSSRWVGAIVAPNGKIYFSPNCANFVGVLDPTVYPEQFTYFDIPEYTFRKYRGGVLAPNGKIYFTPSNADNIGVLDPSDNSFETIDISATISTDNKYGPGGILAPSGKIYFMPNAAPHILEFDPTDGSHVPIPKPEGYGGSGAAAMGPDGKIYQLSGGRINVFNPLDKSFDTVSIPAEVEIAGEYNGAVCSPNGKIYFAPHHMDTATSSRFPNFRIIVLTLGDTSPSYSVSGGLPEEEEAWSALLSPHINFVG